MPDISSETIIRASRGDVAAFEEIYNNTAGFVYNVAWHMLSSREDAQELTQEVFITVHKKLETFRFESSLKTWLYRIAVNLSLNFLKKRNKERARTIPYEEKMETPDMNEMNRKNETFGPDQENLIKKMLDTLNPEQKSCIVLRNIEGLSYQEIAEAMKININTVRSRLKRAREKLMAIRHEVKNEL